MKEQAGGEGGTEGLACVRAKNDQYRLRWWKQPMLSFTPRLSFTPFCGSPTPHVNQCRKIIYVDLLLYLRRC